MLEVNTQFIDDSTPFWYTLGGRFVYEILLSKKAQKQINKLEARIRQLFEDWVESIYYKGLIWTQSYKGYRDHRLIGKRIGQRSASLTKSWRIIYKIEEKKIIILEVNHHEYKK